MTRIPASVLLAPVVLAGLFASSLLGVERIGFRDVSHFYTPLYDYVAERQTQDLLPLWNDLDHTGIPLAGETTTAFFYPIRIAIYWLPLSPESAIAWYVWCHLALASVTAWITARWHGSSSTSACSAALAYSLSGSVFFLYTNLPFLVGAAWMPLAIGPMLCRHPWLKRRRLICVSVALAMMILGGDPQTAFHCGLIIVSVGLFQFARQGQANMPLKDVLLAMILTAMLTAPQLSASIDWSLQSDRNRDSETIHQILDQPLPNSMKQDAYAFSIPPWHLSELWSPSPFGNVFPTNTRMSLRFPNEARMWTPTLYMGIFLGLSLLSIKSRWSRKRIDGWFYLSIFSILASLGSYGLVWIVQASTGTMESYDSGIGGIYWLMYWLIPGYDSFRYPAKWLPFFAIGLSISTAKLLDLPSATERIRRILPPFVLISFVLSIGAWTIHLSHQIIAGPMRNWIPKDPFWGPLQISEAWLETTSSLMFSAIIGTTFMMIFWLNSKYRWKHHQLQIAILAVMVLDLCIAANRQLTRVPINREKALLNQVAESAGPRNDSNSENDYRWLRTREGSGWPVNWKETNSAQRLIEVETSGRLNWFGRWHLREKVSLFNSMTSIRSSSIANFWKASRVLNQEQTLEQRSQFWQDIRNWLSIDGVIITKSSPIELQIDSAEYSLPTIEKRIPNVSAKKSRAGLDHPRATLEITTTWTEKRNITSTSQLMRERLAEITDLKLDPDEPERGEAPTFQTSPSPWIINNSATQLPTPEKLKKPGQPVMWSCSESKMDDATFDVQCHRPTLISRSIYQDGNWKATYRSVDSQTWTPIQVFQVDFLRQGIVLPAGNHELRFFYHPWWIESSLMAGVIGWMALIVVGYRLERRPSQ